MWLALLVSLLGAVVTMSGVLAISRHARWALDNRSAFIGFAAGVLVAVPLIHLVPESLAMTSAAPWGFGAGFLALSLLDRILPTKLCDRADGEIAAIGPAALAGIALHSLFDGVAYSAGFGTSTGTGLLMALGMVLHEFPEGIVAYTLLLYSGQAGPRAVLLSFFVAAISTPIGVLISWPFVDALGADSLGFMLALSAGALLYVGATHLLPQVAADRRMRGLASFIAGAAVAIAGTSVSG